MFHATSTSATIRLGNLRDASNSEGVSRFIYIDAIYSMSLPSDPYRVKFFKVASRAEPSRKDLVFTAGSVVECP